MTLSQAFSIVISPLLLVVWSKGRSFPSQTSVRKLISPLSSGLRNVPSSLTEQVMGDWENFVSVALLGSLYILYSKASSNFFAKPCHVIESGPKWIPGTLRRSEYPMLRVV